MKRRRAGIVAGAAAVAIGGAGSYKLGQANPSASDAWAAIVAPENKAAVKEAALKHAMEKGLAVGTVQRCPEDGSICSVQMTPNLDPAFPFLWQCDENGHRWTDNDVDVYLVTRQKRITWKAMP